MKKFPAKGYSVAGCVTLLTVFGPPLWKRVLRKPLKRTRLARELRTRMFKRQGAMREDGLRRLHWGCGPKSRPGWINVDILEGPGIDLSCDIRDGLPLDDNSIDYIVGIHVLVEIAYSDIVPALKELHRVLKPGGVLRLTMADLEKNIQAYQENTPGYFLIPDSEVTSLGGKFIVQMLWYGGIRTVFTSDFIEELMLKAGFSQVNHCGYKTTQSSFGDGIVELDDRPQESLFVEAVK